MILVTSAAGIVGHSLLRRLVSRGHNVRAFVKNKAQASALRAEGSVEIMTGDLQNPADMQQSIDGVDQIKSEFFQKNTMNGIKKIWSVKNGLILFLVVYHFLIIPALAGDPQTKFPLEEVMTLKGSGLCPLLGIDIKRLNVVTIRNGEPSAIPFQVDEMRDGQYVFEWTSKAGHKSGYQVIDSDQGKLDADDELIVMAWDLGERASGNIEFKAEKVIEISAGDSTDSSHAVYAYILVNSEIPVNHFRYVNFDITDDRVNVTSLRYHYSQYAEMGYYDDLKAVNTSGTLTKNLVVRNFVPAELELKMIGLKGEVDFYDMIKGKMLAFKKGPIRTMMCSEGKASFGIFKIGGKGGSTLNFYPNNINHKIRMNIPFDFDLVLSRLDMRGTLIVNPDIFPVKFYHNDHQEGTILDNGPDREAIVGTIPGNWDVFSGFGASIYRTIKFPEKWAHFMSQILYINKSEKKTEAGLYFGNMVKLLKKGIHIYEVNTHFLPEDFIWGKEKQVPAITDQNLIVRTNVYNQKKYVKSNMVHAGMETL
ncbi:MAG: SDR family oxidoreductase [Proteobacteria bacterium]|nr:SDR family oxidoreductase [Pseudomonadota bacterium]